MARDCLDTCGNKHCANFGPFAQDECSSCIGPSKFNPATAAFQSWIYLSICRSLRGGGEYFFFFFFFFFFETEGKGTFKNKKKK
jgi:hypothetical protein